MPLKSGKKLIPERRKLQERYDRCIESYEVLIRRLQRRITHVFKTNQVRADVRSRVKSFESYFEKLLRLKNESKKLLLTDVLGLRIICPFLEDLYRVENLLGEHFNIVEMERKGMKHSFREFGYDSIHMLIELPADALDELIPYTGNVFEIQLRTILQDAWAEVEHELIYKTNFSLLNDSIKRKLASLNAILTLSDEIFQEIRDYQRENQLRGTRLRQTIEDAVDISSNMSLFGTVETPKDGNGSFSSAMTVKPQNKLERLLYEALQAHSQESYDKAINLYSRILRMKPNETIRSIIYNHRGMAWFIKSDYKKAANDFTKAIEINSKNFRAYNNRGLTFRLMGRYDLALRDFQASLDINKSQYECYYIRALTHYDLQDFAKAMNDCDLAINIKPEFQSAQELKKIIQSQLFR